MDCAWLPNLFLDSESSDVEVHIETTGGENIVIPGHSLVLKRASNVFKVMLETGNFKESLTGQVGIKVQGDISDAIFFLRYLYTKELKNVDLWVYVSLIQCAHLYEINSLVQLCEEKIIANLSPLLVCRMYNLLQNIGSEIFLKKCQELMLRSAFLIFSKNLHLTVTEETMIFLLSSDHLNVIDEEQVVGALWQWGCVKHCQNELFSNKNFIDRLENLLVMVRWTFVNEVKENSPWFSLTNTVKSEIASGKRTVLPVSANLREKHFGSIFLSHYAEDCTLLRGSQDIKEEDTSPATHCLMMFTVSCDIFIIGLTIEVTSCRLLQDKLPFRIFLNKTDVSGSITSKRNLLCTYKRPKDKKLTSSHVGSTKNDHRTMEHAYPHYHQEAQYDLYYRGIRTVRAAPAAEAEAAATSTDSNYVYNICIEFHTAVLLRKSDILKITLQAMNNDSSWLVCLPEYYMPCRPKNDKIVNFNMLDKIKGLRQLKYFPL